MSDSMNVNFNVHPMNVKSLTKKQKVAIAASSAIAVAAAGSAIAAFAVGKKVNPDAKFLATLKNGYVKMGQVIKNGAVKCFSKVKKFFTDKKVKETATEVVDNAKSKENEIANISK